MLTVCPRCALRNPSGALHCSACRAPLGKAAALATPEPERRQVTMLFCDLAGSTELGADLDPEDLRDVILGYQRACTAAITQRGGTVTRFVGDGILALFGYPLAHEDDAVRAAQAGLDVVTAVRELPLAGGKALRVRVGIATGLVVVSRIGEGAAEEDAVHGNAPNLAARLQGLAPPDGVLVSATTRSLLGERFECIDLGRMPLKGFAEPEPVHRLLAARPLDTLGRRGRVPLVNRVEEMHWLELRWRNAREGRGGSALIAGEAGIGKSRIVAALHERIGEQSHALLSFQCSPQYTNTALHAVSERIALAAGIGRESPDEQKLARLAEWLGPGLDEGEPLALLATLLAIPLADARVLATMSPERRRERTFQVLMQVADRMAAQQPLLVVFEDLHWADPTTLDLLPLLVERSRRMRMLLLMTARPDFAPRWSGTAPVDRIELARLSPSDAACLVCRVAGDEAPEQGMVDQLVARTDGIPLYIEELTKAALQGGQGIPVSLHDSLMARLDRLGDARGIAQRASVIGREFAVDLLAAVMAVPAQTLASGLRTLEDADIVRRVAGAERETYEFRHALIQQAANESLLRRRRRALHAAIAQALSSQFPGTVRDAPELLAHHWTEAADPEPATAAWLAAGRRASERSQYREALGHLRKGLALVTDIADPSVRRARELELHLALGPALITTEGGGAPEVATTYARALALCEGEPPSASHFVARWGWWRASMDLRTGRSRADDLLALARSLQDPDLLLQAHHCQWATLYMLGALDECCRHIGIGLGMYDPARHHPHAALYGGHDVRVCALGELAVARWLLGHPDSARGHVLASVAAAEQMAHVGSRAHAMDYALVLHKFRREPSAVAVRARELIAYAAEQKLRDHHAKGRFFHGWAVALTGSARAGLDEMNAAMAAFEDVGTPEDVSVYHEMIAEVCGRLGRYEEGLREIDEAFAQTARCGILFWNAELHRRRGLLLAAAGENDDRVDAIFREALEGARAQGALALELRAALSLARLHARHGDAWAVHELLAPVHARFGEGADTPDLREARALLDDHR